LVVGSRLSSYFSEKLKEMLHIFRFDANTSVNNRSEKSAGDFIIENVNFDGAFECEFKGVAYKIKKDLFIAFSSDLISSGTLFSTFDSS
jgi:hypothetical protein